MATLKYFTKGTGNPRTIHFRLLHGRKFDFTRSTQLIIDPKYWNNKKGAVKQISEFTDKVNLQNNLNELRNHIFNAFNHNYAKGQIIDSDWLRNTINGFFDQNEDTDFNYLIDYVNYFVENLKNSVQPNGKMGATKATINKYRTIVNKLKEFETYKKKRLRVLDVNLIFHKDFI